MSGSTIPAALDAIVLLCQTALPDFQVLDGPDYDARINFLAIGWDGEDTPAITVQRSIADAQRGRDQEVYDITSLLSAHSSQGTSAVRVTVFDAFESIMQALNADQTLGGVVARAWVSEYALAPVLAETGATATLRFTVNVTAWK